MESKTLSKSEAERRYSALAFFTYEHLPYELQSVSKPFCDLAWQTALRFSNHPAEVAVCLRKLLEAKDAAVRASLMLDEL